MAKLTTAARKAIPSSKFALPGRRYPIEDAAHARNALARVSQHGTSSEKATVRAKVHSKYPDIGKSMLATGMKKKTWKKGETWK
jgi:hypothetical protein